MPKQDPWENPITSWLQSTFSAPPPYALQFTGNVCCWLWPPESLTYVMQRIRKVCHAWWILLSPGFNQTLYAGIHVWAKMNLIKTNSLVLARLDRLIFPAILHNLRWKKLVITLAFYFSTLCCRLITHLFILTIHLLLVSPSSISLSSKKKFSFRWVFPCVHFPRLNLILFYFQTLFLSQLWQLLGKYKKLHGIKCNLHYFSILLGIRNTSWFCITCGCN